MKWQIEQYSTGRVMSEVFSTPSAQKHLLS